MPTYLMSFIDNWLNQFSFSYKFLKSRSWHSKKTLTLRTQMITSLDHSLVQVLNKQKNKSSA
jgi:hypothetical protein